MGHHARVTKISKLSMHKASYHIKLEADRPDGGRWEDEDPRDRGGVSLGILSLRQPPLSDERGFMAFVIGPKDGGESSEKELIARLRKFVEDSDLSFYKIASRIGTSGGILSMWLAKTTRPRPKELDAIEKFLER